MTDKHRKDAVEFREMTTEVWDEAVLNVLSQNTELTGVERRYLGMVGNAIARYVLETTAISRYHSIEDIARASNRDLSDQTKGIGPKNVRYVDMILDQILADRKQKRRQK